MNNSSTTDSTSKKVAYVRKLTDKGCYDSSFGQVRLLYIYSQSKKTSETMSPLCSRNCHLKIESFLIRHEDREMKALLLEIIQNCRLPMSFISI